MASDLPFEIIELILDIVANNDYHQDVILAFSKSFNNTKACALVNRMFLYRCRQHLFHSVTIFSNWKSSTTTRNLAQHFAQLITDNPEIPKLVRKLDYVVRMDDTSLDYRIPPALAALTNLEELKFSLSKGSFSWDAIEPTSRSTLLHLMQRVASLHLIHIRHFRVSDLIQCTNLTKLDLDFVSVAYERENVISSSEIPSSTISLQHLGLKQVHPTVAEVIVEWLRPDGRRILDLNRLKSISIIIGPDLADLFSAREVFQGIQSLETVWISVVHMDDVTDAILCLISPFLETLSTLTITLSLYDGSRNHPLCGVCRLFQLLAGRNRIRSLAIRVRIPKQLDCSVGDEWGELESVLLSSGWSFLVQLDLTIIASGVREDRWLEKALMKLPETQFEGLVSSKQVAFNFSAREIKLPS